MVLPVVPMNRFTEAAARRIAAHPRPAASLGWATCLSVGIGACAHHAAPAPPTAGLSVRIRWDHAPEGLVSRSVEVDGKNVRPADDAIVPTLDDLFRLPVKPGRHGRRTVLFRTTGCPAVRYCTTAGYAPDMDGGRGAHPPHGLPRSRRACKASGRVTGLTVRRPVRDIVTDAMKLSSACLPLDHENRRHHRPRARNPRPRLRRIPNRLSGQDRRCRPVADLGHEAQAVDIPPIVGAIAVVAGIGLIVAGRKK